MSNKKIFEDNVEYGVPGDPNATTPFKGANPDIDMRSDGGPAYAPRPVQKPVTPDPTPAPKPAPKPAPAPAPKPDPTPTDPHGGLPAIPWKQIAIVAGAAGLLAALIALIRKCTKSIKLRFNKSVRTLARMQKDFTINKNGLDMRAVLPGVGSRLNDFITRVFSGSAFMNNGRTGVMGNTKAARKFKDGVIGLYPFCDIYKEEIRNDLTMAQTTFNKIKFAADSAENSGGEGGNANNSNESVNSPVYQSFYEAFASERLNESENGQVNESTVLALAALAPMVIRGGAFIVNKIKDGKADPKEAKTVQVTKQSTREICYAILNNFFEKYISFEQVSKKMGVDIKGLSDIDESTIDKFQAVLKKYQNPDGASVVKQYARVKGAYDKMLGHYLNIGNGIIKNFEKYTKADDEKHENLLVASKEKLQAMWDQQKDQYDNLFPYVLNEIINDGAYAQYIDFIIESVLPVFKTGIAGDADYVLDVMPKKGDYFLLSQTAQGGTIGNKAICRITSDYDKESKNIGMSLIALYKGGTTLTPEGNIELTDSDSDQFDTKAYKAAPTELEYHRFMALDPHQIVNMEEILKKNMKLDIASFVDKEILVLDKDVETFESVLSELGKSDVTAVVYKIKAVEDNEITYVVEYISNKKDIASRVKYDEAKGVFRANKEDFETAAESEENMKEYKLPVDELTEKQKPVTFTGNIQTLDSNTKFTFAVNEKGKTVSYEGFVNQGKDAQEIFLKGTLTVDNDEEKAKNDENGRNSTFMKIARVNIDKEVNGKDIVEYLTDTYGAKFEKQKNDEFAKALAAEAKDNQNLATQSFTDITTPDQTSDVITAVTNELMDMYEQQANSKDGGATDVNPLTQTAWIGEESGIKITVTPILKDRQSKDENPEIIGLAASANNGKTPIYGKIAVTGDFNSVKERIDKAAPEFLKYEDNIEDAETTTAIANIGRVKDENVQVTAELKQDDDFKKFIAELLKNSTGKNKDPKAIYTYLSNLIMHLNDNVTLDYDKNSKPEQQDNKDNNNPNANSNPNANANSNPNDTGKSNTGSTGVGNDNPNTKPGVEDTPARTKEWSGKDVQPQNSSAEESVNEDNQVMGHNDPNQISKDLENKNIKVNVTKEPSGEENEYDGTKTEVSDNKLTVTCGKLFYNDAEGNQQPVKFEFEFCLSSQWKPGEYKPTVVIKNIYTNKLRSFVWPLNVARMASVLQKSFDKMEIYLGEMKKEESLNEKKAKVQESINFAVTYATNDKVIESAAFNTGINRKITADRDCSQYYVLSECMWSCANDETVKKALASKVTAALKNCRTKESLMEYAKANQNVEFTKNFADMSYTVRKPGNLHSIIGCSLFECAVAVKFNSNNVVSNAIGIGVNKIS